jgi:O-methyltransferase involved in polyketide biosynthesis
MKKPVIGKYIPQMTGYGKKSSEYSFMASVSRYYNIDSMVTAFCSKLEKSNIVYLGAGLETAYYRLNGQNAIFYEVDLPDVIATRRSVLGEHSDEILLGGDLFNLAWTEQIDKSISTLLLVSGVFQYFTKEKVIKFIDELRNIFKEAELIFDATNETGIKYANKYVRKTGNDGALMHFYVNDCAEFANLTATTLIEERVFFTEARKMLSKKRGFTAYCIEDC